MLGGNSLTIQATVTVASASAGSGFDGQLIIGDAAAAALKASLHPFVQAMASLVASDGGGSRSVDASARPAQALLLSPHSLAEA
jgi:hypothetical protein